jgi:aspartate/methionine/tyrosine aminotransferase
MDDRLNPRLARLPGHPFTRLRALLDDLAPRPGIEPLNLSLGDPQHATPPLLAETIAANAHLWGTYPPNHGTPELRQAIAAWLCRRYALAAETVDAERHVLPVAGTREALFMVADLVVPEPPVGVRANAAPARRPKAMGRRAAVLLPNPNYHVYAGAVAMSGGEAFSLPVTAETGFLPDLAAIDAATLERTAMMVLCSPANPQGAVADRAYLAAAIGLARRHRFVLVVDECYAEIYGAEAPPGALEVCAGLDDGSGEGFDGVVVFHSLSKRSSAAGLRSGFVAGDAAVIDAFKSLRVFSSAMVPLPVMAAATALWGDEAHVALNRDRYRAKFDLAETVLAGYPGFYRPAGSFYLWLDVGDGEAATRRLWSEAAIRVLPGAYMGLADAAGVNPGTPYVRIALVHDIDVLGPALERLAATLA